MSKIWKNSPTDQSVCELLKGNMCEHVGIELVELGNDFLEGRMPVDQRTKQPDGILHGGANVVLAESLGSIAANLCLDRSTKMAVGIEVNANHIRSASKGFIIGKAMPIQIGQSIHVWEIRIRREDDDKLSCVSRLTMAIVPRPKLEP